MTDLVFLNDNLIVCGNLSDKILYLIKLDYNSGSYKILHSVEIPYHVDLMTSQDNLIYIVNLNDYLTVCEVSNNRITVKQNIYFNNGCLYHGICVNPANKFELFLTSTRLIKKITIYNVNSKKWADYVIPRLENCFLKDIIFVNQGQVIIIACDKGPNKSVFTYKSYINLYNYNPSLANPFTFVDGLTYADCTVDSVVYTDGVYYVTAQMDDCGYIMSGFIEGGFIIPYPHKIVVDFPHGMAVSPSKKYIGYTSYDTSSVYITEKLNLRNNILLK